MTATIFKPKGRSYFVAQYTDPYTGKKKTLSTRATTKEDAIAYAFNNGLKVKGYGLSDYYSRADMICQQMGMPEIPRQKIEARTIKDTVDCFDDLTGVYFKWLDGEIVYIGKSRNIPERVTSSGHMQLKPTDNVSFLEFPENQIHYAELFYIAIVRPRLNYEVRQMLG